MLEHLKALLLGIIQGLTEFLPVSSSGHLELANYFFGERGIPKDQVLMTVTLHLATVLATLIVFRKDIQSILMGVFRREKSALQYAGFIILSMIPAVFIGLVFEDVIDALFDSNILLVGSMLILTGIGLLVSDKVKGGKLQIRNASALLIGFAQAIAILPGISRSGATIGTALLLGVNREEAARFSFLMVIPVILGKVALDIIQGDYTHTTLPFTVLLVGFFAALISGYFACRWMISIVRRARLAYFGWYCLTIGLIGVAWVLVIR